MAICKFFANGYCRHGNNCRFEHIRSQGSSSSSNVYSKTYSSNSTSSQYGSNSRLNYDQSHHHQQPPPQRSDGRESFSFSKAADLIAQIPQSTNSVFSFNKAASGQNLPASGSTFSFNNAAEMLSSLRPKTFSFANTLHQVNMGGGSSNSSLFSVPSVPHPATSFSFNDMLARVQQNEKPAPQAAFFQQQPQQPQTSSIFGNQTVTNPQQHTTSSFFNNTHQQQQHPSQTPSFFNVPANASSSIFGGGGGNKNQPTSSQLTNFAFGGKDPSGGMNAANIITLITGCQWYTPLDKLTDDDKALFEQKEFTSIIPLVPPPLEMCH